MSASAPSLLLRYRERCGGDAMLFRAPGRINIIGEHTDYNDGFVLPAAIPIACRAATGVRADRKLMVSSTAFAETICVDLDRLTDLRPRRDWSDYPIGVAVALAGDGARLKGANLLIESDIPMGGGLSSSAAIEVASALALLAVADQERDLDAVARLCQRAENMFVGARCGIMDQIASCCGRAGMALWLDCRTLDRTWVPVPHEACFVVCDTMVKHSLASSEYNRRRAECEEAVHRLGSFLPAIQALRDVEPDQLAAHASCLPPTLLRRARHVIEENGRVLLAAAALRSGDLARVGALMNASHASLRDLYEVSCRELDVMVELAMRQPGLHGARMMGGGFGGCTINLVEASYVDEFRSSLSATYAAAIGRVPDIFVCEPASGASRIEVSA